MDDFVDLRFSLCQHYRHQGVVKTIDDDDKTALSRSNLLKTRIEEFQPEFSKRTLNVPEDRRDRVCEGFS